MADPPKVTGDIMAKYVEDLLGLNYRQLSAITEHMKNGYTEPVKYQAALGEIAMMLVEQQPILREMDAIIKAHNKKKNRKTGPLPELD